MADLTTLAKARRQLFGNDPAIEADEILAALITSSSAWVEREVGGDLMLALVTETRDGNGTTRLLLNRSHSWRPGRPVTTVSSLKIDGSVIPARPAVTTTDTNPSGYVIDGDAIDLVGYCFTSGTANVVVTYMAGYTDTPTDIEQAVLEHIALRYRDRGHIGQDAASTAGESVNYGNAGTLAFIEGVLSSYRAMGFA
jgi:hypothetical protein